MECWHSQPTTLPPHDKHDAMPQKHTIVPSILFYNQPEQRLETQANYRCAMNESTMSYGEKRQPATVPQSEEQQGELSSVLRGAETSEIFLYTAARLRSMPSIPPALEECCDFANAILNEFSEGGGPSLERNLDILNRLNEVMRLPLKEPNFTCFRN
jgi:hypothetical protein